ncbi:MAG TPA: response regulator [Candidatus Tumulicola sp.]|nr:response regulator [Candidatus Tumulicola sp.]
MPARILIVEDNQANLHLMTYLLQAFGHSTTSVMDGLAGVAAIKAGSFDLVLTDVRMPGIDGYEMARRVKTDPATQKLRLIAVTAAAMVGDREHALAAGFDGYISKPIVPQRFVAEVDEYLPAALRSNTKGEGRES